MVASAMPISAPAHPSVVEARKKVNRTLLTLAVVTVVVIVVLVAIPLPVPFSFGISDPGGATSSTCHTYSFDPQASVSFRWSTPNGNTVTFSVINPNGNVIYDQDTTSGSGSFTSIGSGYQFCVYSWDVNSVSVSGTTDQTVL